MKQATSDPAWQNDPEMDLELKALLEKAEAQVSNATEEFRAEARQDIEDLQARLAVVACLKNPPIEVKKNCCKETIMLAQHLGDVMASYNCQLGSDVAYSLKNLVEMAPEANDCLARAVGVHLLVLDNLLKEGACGNGGEAGREIKENLRRVCRLANIVTCPTEIDVIAI